MEKRSHGAEQKAAQPGHKTKIKGQAPSLSTRPLGPLRGRTPRPRASGHRCAAPRPSKREASAGQRHGQRGKSAERKHVFIKARSKTWLGSRPNPLIFHMRKQMQKGHLPESPERQPRGVAVPRPWRQRCCGPRASHLTSLSIRAPRERASSQGAVGGSTKTADVNTLRQPKIEIRQKGSVADRGPEPRPPEAQAPAQHPLGLAAKRPACQAHHPWHRDLFPTTRGQAPPPHPFSLACGAAACERVSTETAPCEGL